MTRGARAQLAEILELVRSAADSRSDAAASTAASSRGRSRARSGRGSTTSGCRVVPEHIAPQHFGNVGHAHGRAGMSRIRGLHGIHGERANGIRQGAAGGGAGWGIHKGRALSDRREPRQPQNRGKRPFAASRFPSPRRRIAVARECPGRTLPTVTSPAAGAGAGRPQAREAMHGLERLTPGCETPRFA